MKWKKFVALLLLVCISIFGTKYTQAQKRASNKEKQPWVDGNLPPGNTNYRYMVAHGEGSSVKASREDARLFLLMELGFSKGVKIQTSESIQLKTEDKYANGEATYNATDKRINSYTINGEGYSISVAAVDEYYEWNRNTCQMQVLYQVSEREFIPIRSKYTKSYGFAAVWRSAIVPGWGQFYKKKTGKGLFFLSTEVVLIGTAVYSGMQYSDNVRKSQETTKLSLKKEYRNRADEWELRRNIAIGTAAGVYVWNLLDAALAKGKLKYAWIPDQMQMTAYSNTEGLQFYGLTYKF